MPKLCGVVVVFATSLGSPPAATAQPFAAGVVVGVSASTFADFRDVGPATVRREAGLLAGVYLELPVTRVVSLQPEVAYAQKGSRLEGPAMPGATSTAVVVDRFDYVEVPILVRLGATAGRSGLYLLAGPAIGVLVRAREHFEAPGVAIEDQDIKDGVTGTDASLVIGGGVAFGRVGLEGRADLGVRNLVPPADRRPGDPEPKNRSFALVARLRL